MFPLQHHHNLHAANSYHHYMRAGGTGSSVSPYSLHRQSPAGSSGNLAGGGGSGAGGSGSGYHSGPPRFL